MVTALAGETEIAEKAKNKGNRQLTQKTQRLAYCDSGSANPSG
jgi:hypothetical protein